LTGKTGQYFYLPTEAEWQYAAQSGETENEWAGTEQQEDLPVYAVYSETITSQRPAAVKSKRPNSFGLFDMSGNVHEWVQECFDDDEDSSLTRLQYSLQADVLFQLPGIFRQPKACEHVIRGGSWQCGPQELTTSARDKMHRTSRSNDVGFRVALKITK
jgi:formylglycine-generating enzyme required for sulfatase activity